MSMRSPPPTAWRPVIAMLALVAATAVTNAATLATDHPRRSCRAHRDDGNAAQDGEYPLLVPSGEMVVVYCHMMGHNAASEPGAPFEYITLPAPLSPGAGGGLVNAAQWVMGPFVTTTTFTRVRLDFRNLTIRTGDFTFATTVTTSRRGLVAPAPATFCNASQRYPGGGGLDALRCFNQQPPAACSGGAAPAFGVPFGIAGWCTAMSDGLSGLFCGGTAADVTDAAEASIDLTGTSFVLDDDTNLAAEVNFAAGGHERYAMFVDGANAANTTISEARDVLRTRVLYRDTPTYCAMVWDRHWLTANAEDRRSRRQGGSSIYLRSRTEVAPAAAVGARGFGQTGFELHSYTDATASSCDGAHLVEVAAFTPTTDRVCGLPTLAPTTSEPTPSPTGHAGAAPSADFAGFHAENIIAVLVLLVTSIALLVTLAVARRTALNALKERGRPCGNGNFGQTESQTSW